MLLKASRKGQLLASPRIGHANLTDLLPAIHTYISDGAKVTQVRVTVRKVCAFVWQVSEEVKYVTNMVRKDVLRTDRHHPYFSGADDNNNVQSLYNILTT